MLAPTSRPTLAPAWAQLPGPGEARLSHLAHCLSFPLGRPFLRMCVFPTLTVSLAGAWSLFSPIPVPCGWRSEASRLRPPTPRPAGMQAPPTCKHRGAVGITDIGVWGVDVLRVEDEDSQHDWREKGLRAPRTRRGLEKVGEDLGAARESPHWRRLEEEGRLGSLAADSDLLLLKWNRPASGCSGATLGPRTSCVYPACQRALGELGLLLIFHPRRPTRLG